MTPTWVSDCGTVQLYLGDCRDVLPTLGHVDAVVTDPPFSERTHNGHDLSANGHAGIGHDGSKRNAIGYAPWTAEEVNSVVQFMPSKGWVCILTDHVLAREWERALLGIDRYVFAPIPLVVPGRSVRLSGDGPSSWTNWVVVSRTATEAKWGTLPGYYQGRASEIQHMGGKPLDAMSKIVGDYSREGDCVLDFCMGSGTTGVACVRSGRRFIGIEICEKYFEISKDRIQRELNQLKLAL